MMPVITPPQYPILEKPNHVLHLLLSVLTAGLWIIVWICCAVAVGGRNNDRIRWYNQQTAAYQWHVQAQYAAQPRY